MNSLNKVKLTSQTAWQTEKQINDNFSAIETAIDEEIPTKTSDLTNDGDGNSYQVHSGYDSFSSTSDYVGYYVLVSTTYTKVTTTNKDSLDIVAGTTIAYELSPFATEEYVRTNGGKIDSISVNGVAQTIDANKNVDITVPDELADLGDDSTHRLVTDSEKSTWNAKQDSTDNNLDTNSKTIVGGINEVNAVAKQANIAKSFASYSALITELNGASATAFKVGQSLYVQTQEVPDLWIISIESSSSTYTYTTDAAFISATGASGGQQVGYYKLAQLETQKVDLSNYVQKTTTIAGVDLQDNITVAEMQSALEDTTHRFVTDTEKSTWNAKQNAIIDLSFTASDAGWSSLDSDGFYTLTITSAKKPFAVYNSSGEQVLAGLKSDGTYVYVITDTKFSGTVSVR